MPGSDAENYAMVALDVPLHQTFTYRVPKELRGEVAAGKRVEVPFGRRRLVGYCVGTGGAVPPDPGRVRDIVRVLDSEPLISPALLHLTRWIAEMYVCPWGRVLNEALPAVVREGAARREVYVRALKPPEELRARAAALEKRAPRRAALLRALAENGTELSLAQLREHIGAVSRAQVCEPGFAEVFERRFQPDVLGSYRVPRTEPLPPTPEQQAALDAIGEYLNPPRFGVFLLHGVTGSGKTEVYLQALRRVVDAGRQGIVLVPEISLTPQTIRRFLERFDHAAVLHSRITDAERREQWRRIREENPDVVIGARSAIFAPVRALGMIVIDEEHEPSYKQPASPRYHAREAAIERARAENAVVVLGSATPSLESYYRAQQGEYRLLRLPRRVEARPLPHVQLVDMRKEYAEQKGFVLISRQLREAMARTLAHGEQVLLFLNRRGFSTYIHCPRCGHVLRCPACDVSLTYHRTARTARCHSCNHTTPAPELCPECRQARLNYFGSGTQRVEELVQRLFPDHPIARMDSDTTATGDSHRRILDDFTAGRTHILLGTQMIGKGLDFPNLTLVGVINADTALHLPDFRATERTFQLLTQVAGRTGRSFRGGRVLVQTSAPQHNCIRCAVSHDYEAFAEDELRHRRAHNYPPFCRLARVIVSSTDPRIIPARAKALGELLRHYASPRTQIVGPMEAPIARLRGWHRWHFIIKAPPPPARESPPQATSQEAAASQDELARLFRLCEPSLRPTGNLRIIVDVDPVTML